MFVSIVIIGLLLGNRTVFRFRYGSITLRNKYSSLIGFRFMRGEY